MKSNSSKIRLAMAGVMAAAMCLAGSAGAQTAPNNNSLMMTPSTSAAQLGAQKSNLPYVAGEVVRLYQRGISKDVILNYINSSVYPYHLTADQIIYLQQIGIPKDITQAMLLRDQQLEQEQRQGMVTPYAAVNNEPQMVVPTTPAPDVSVAGYPDYYDYYGYPYYYDYGWPYVVGGGWWGWPYGWGHGWGWGGHGYYRGGFGGFHGGVGGFHGGGFRGGGGFHGGGGFGGHGGGGGHR